MKKLFRYLRERLNVFNPWYLREQITILEKMVIGRDKIIDECERQPDEATARAMLMQLRVHQESVRRRTGYMVSAFIPQGAVEKLVHLGADQQKAFVTAVAEVLINSAMNGIYKRSQATGKLTALIFEPITKRGQNVQLVGGIFETDQRPEFVPMVSDAELKEKVNFRKAVLLPVPGQQQLTN